MIVNMRICSRSGAVSRKLVLWICIPVVLIGMAYGSWSAARIKEQRARAAWKGMALQRLSGVSLPGDAIIQELQMLKSSRVAGGQQDWAGEQVIVMTNDEYLVYASRHGHDNGSLDHLFLAHGSDGRWYYSTYHFCNNMAGVIGDDPPGTIADFARRYAVREFDGKSDVCLQHTWP